MAGRTKQQKKFSKEEQEDAYEKKQIIAGVLAVVLALSSVQGTTFARGMEQEAKMTVQSEMKSAMQENVQLTDGMFKESRDIGEQYLTSYDVERLAVSLFRYSSKRADAPVDMNNGYGGWEDSGENGIGGHIFGHYMSACVAMYRQTGREQLKKNVERGVELLGAAQGIYTPAAQGLSNGSWRDVKNGFLSYDIKVIPSENNYVLSLF